MTIHAAPPKSNDGSRASESTPLLADVPPIPIEDGSSISQGSSGNACNDDTHGDDDRPLPKMQIFLLCFARMVEPIAFFGIFPFIAQMIWEMGGMEESDVGFYSGLIESMFSLTQMILMISWGRAADRIGRKPVLVFSLCGVAIATAIFGLSKTVWQMVLFRCCAGLFAGNIVTVRAMITENSTPKTQARAFSFFAFSGNLGIFLGPLIGGGLSNPAKQFGGIFARTRFFNDFPYALPTFVTGTVSATAAIVSAFFIKETLKRKTEGSNAMPKAPMTTLELVNSPGVGHVLFLYGHVMLLGLAYTAVQPVFMFTSIDLGGFGFTPFQISMFIALIGVSQAAWLLLAFPYLQNRYSTGTVLRGCLYAWPIFFLSSPLCNTFLRHGWTTLFWVVAPIFLIGGSGVAMAFTCVQLALNDISPSPQTLGTLNALALSLTAGIRTIGPAAFTSLFAAGARTQFINGYLVWFVLTLLALAGTLAVRWLPEKAEGRLKKSTSNE